MSDSTCVLANIKDFDVAKFDEILNRGLSSGMGDPNKQVCIEAAICLTLGMPHGDDPKCVSQDVRSFKIVLNDSQWSSPAARAKGLRDLGLAQLGSLGAVSGVEFTKRLAEKTIRQLLPMLFRELFPADKTLLAAALRCENEGTAEAARAAAEAAEAARAAKAARAARAAAGAARAAAEAAEAAAGDKYLILSASLALETLRELNSPGVSLL